MADTWYAITDASGNLLSTGTVIGPLASYTARKLTVITLAGDPTGQLWNPATRTFSPPVADPNVYSKADWLRRFTLAELAAFRNSADASIVAFRYIFENDSTVIPQGPDVQAALARAVSIGTLTAARAVIIGAN